MINLALPNLLKNAFFILKNVLDYKVNKDVLFNRLLQRPVVKDSLMTL